jgi:arylsulfatase A-like enzyme
LLGLLQATSSPAAPRPPLYWEFQGSQALRAGPWKLFRPRPQVPAQLYHLQRDPGESQDLAAAEPAWTTALLALLEAARVESPLFPLARQ